jgi:hypothetical protein
LKERDIREEEARKMVTKKGDKKKRMNACKEETRG